MVLRSLAEGKAIGIYPEGERSWDGEIQPFRRGTIRLLLKAGVPVVPCGDLRVLRSHATWSKTIRRARVRVQFGEPILWPAMDDRTRRNAPPGGDGAVDGNPQEPQTLEPPGKKRSGTGLAQAPRFGLRHPVETIEPGEAYILSQLDIYVLCDVTKNGNSRRIPLDLLGMEAWRLGLWRTGLAGHRVRES